MNSKIERISTVGMSREDWLAERKQSLGGSDMGAVLGLNKWSSPFSVWAEKTGRLPDKPDNEAMRIGRDLEPYVLKRFAEASGKKVHRVNAILRNPDAPCLHANVDSVVANELSGVEAKTASALNEKRFAGGSFPESYYAQCVTYLAVTEYTRWYLAVLIMGREFKIYQMTRIEDDACPDWCCESVFVPETEIEALKLAALTFWREHVEVDVPPAADGSDATSDALEAVYDAEDGREIDLTPVEHAVRALLKLKADKKELDDLITAQENEIKGFMGTASAGRTENAKISWKVQTRKSFDSKKFAAEHRGVSLDPYYKESSSRVFRVTAK